MRGSATCRRRNNADRSADRRRTPGHPADRPWPRRHRNRSRKRSSCLGLIEKTEKPRSRKVSTTGPCGTSSATAIVAASRPWSSQSSHTALPSRRRYAEKPVPQSPYREHPERGLVLLGSPVDSDKPTKSSAMFFPLHDRRATTTPTDPCTGARRRNFLLGFHRGQPAGAHVPSWCSKHGGKGSLPTGQPVPVSVML